jgi:ATP-dependent helicase Lhr and Lhr-like helicase
VLAIRSEETAKFRVSPLAVPVMLEIGRESVYGEASEALLAEAEANLVNEAME